MGCSKSIGLSCLSLTQILLVLSGLITTCLVTLLGFRDYSLDAARNEMLLSVNQLEHAMTSPLIATAQQLRTLANNQRGANDICTEYVADTDLHRDVGVLRQCVAAVRTNPLLTYAYQVYRSPRNASVAGDCGTQTIDGNYRAYYNDPSPTATDGSFVSVRYAYNESDFPQLVGPPVVVVDPFPWNSMEYAYGQVLDVLTPSDLEAGHWSRIDIWFEPLNNLTYPLLSYFMPLAFDAVGVCTAMIEFDINLQSVSDRLVGITGRRLEMMVFDVAADSNDTLVAWTSPLPVYDTAASTGYSAATLPDPRFAGLLSAMQAQLGCSAAVSACNTTEFLSVSWAEHRDVATLRRFSLGNLQLALIMFAGRDVFYAASDRALTISIGVCVAVVVVSIGIGFAVWRATVPPLQSIVENMQLAASFRNHMMHRTSSRVTEIERLDQEVNQLHRKLRAARPFMPRAVVNRDTGDGTRQPVMPAAGRGTAAPAPDSVATQTQRTFADTTTTAAGGDTERSYQTRRTITLSDGSSSVYVVAGLGRQAPQLATEIGLESRVVVVAALNVVSYQRLVGVAAIADFLRTHGDLVDIVTARAAQHRGIVELAHGDQFLVSFNASSRVRTPQIQSVSCVLDIQRDVAEKFDSVVMTGGLASGRCHVGNLGTQRMRQFTIFGAPVKQALTLQRLARGYPEHPVLVTSPVIDDVHGANFHHRWLARVRLPPFRRPISVAAVVPIVVVDEHVFVPTPPHGVAEDAPSAPAVAPTLERPPSPAAAPAVCADVAAAVGQDWMHRGPATTPPARTNPYRDQNVLYAAAVKLATQRADVLARSTSTASPRLSSTLSLSHRFMASFDGELLAVHLGHYFDQLL